MRGSSGNMPLGNIQFQGLIVAIIDAAAAVILVMLGSEEV
jgi:hypothetical protein